ncbi:MAG: hypothetical protein H0W25_15605, partial [Acidimicrobiia bacterium]|nr:hypothetical protein [Acidimicrobiia bacterium]
GGGAPPAPAAPTLPGGGRSALDVAALNVARSSQPRGQGAWLDVYDNGGPLGRFVETTPAELEGASIICLAGPAGDTVLSIVHPGRGSRARVDGPNGPYGFVSRVGRVRANLELHGPGRRPEGEPLATLRPLDDHTGWAAATPDGESIARLRVWELGAPSPAAYGEARYELVMGPAAGRDLRPLLLALPVLVDRGLTQPVARGE